MINVLNKWEALSGSSAGKNLEKIKCFSAGHFINDEGKEVVCISRYAAVLSGLKA